MKIRLMSTPKQNSEFLQILKKMPGVDILSISEGYKNRGNSVYERIYVELSINTIWTPADFVEPAQLASGTILIE